MPYVSHWLKEAREAIAKAHDALPPDATLAERKKAIEAAYPFGPRANFPYKQWLKARREYLAGFTPREATSGPAWREKMRALGYDFADDDGANSA